MRLAYPYTFFSLYAFILILEVLVHGRENVTRPSDDPNEAIFAINYRLYVVSMPPGQSNEYSLAPEDIGNVLSAQVLRSPTRFACVFYSRTESFVSTPIKYGQPLQHRFEAASKVLCYTLASDFQVSMLVESPVLKIRLDLLDIENGQGEVRYDFDFWFVWRAIILEAYLDGVRCELLAFLNFNPILTEPYIPMAKSSWGIRGVVCYLRLGSENQLSE